MTRSSLVKDGLTSLVLLLLVTAISFEASAQRRRPSNDNRNQSNQFVDVPAGTIIRVRMDTELNSRSAHTGQHFSTTVSDAVRNLIPAGSKIDGRITTVGRARQGRRGTIGVTFDSLTVNGKRYSINGSLTDSSGSRKRDAVFIGGGAATGAIIGSQRDASRTGASSTDARRPTNTAQRVYEKEQEAEVKSGMTFGVALNSALSLPGNRP